MTMTPAERMKLEKAAALLQNETDSPWRDAYELLFDVLHPSTERKSLWLIECGRYPMNEEYPHLRGALRKIDVIKAIRWTTSLGLREAKELVERAPCEIGRLAPDSETVTQLEQLGCKLEWR